jgi:hypothetical protein
VQDGDCGERGDDSNAEIAEYAENILRKSENSAGSALSV